MATLTTVNACCSRAALIATFNFQCMYQGRVQGQAGDTLLVTMHTLAILFVATVIEVKLSVHQRHGAIQGYAKC